MPSGATYEPIATQTLVSSSSLITFSNIPQTYTDLVIVGTMFPVSGGSNNCFMRFNSDSNTNYSGTYYFADPGGSPTSYPYRNSNQTGLGTSYGNSQAGREPWWHTNILNYSNTNMYKTVIVKNGWADTWFMMAGQLWRSTSAITTITFSPASGQTDFAAGTKITIYGIAAA